MPEQIKGETEYFKWFRCTNLALHFILLYIFLTLELNFITKFTMGFSFGRC